MAKVNIFEQGKEMKAGWAKFEKIGDEVQGTYVGKKNALGGKFKTLQIVYELMDESGNIILVGIKETDKVFHDFMNHVHLGQIIGVKYIENIDTGKGNPFKKLVIYADPKIVDNDWLNGESNKVVQSTIPAPSQNLYVEDNEPVSTEQDPIFGDAPFITDEDRIKKIIEIAGAKFGLADANEIKNKVMETTGLAFISSNLETIIKQLMA